jgi:hypothetical protein
MRYTCGDAHVPHDLEKAPVLLPFDDVRLQMRSG